MPAAAKQPFQVPNLKIGLIGAWGTVGNKNQVNTPESIIIIIIIIIWWLWSRVLSHSELDITL